jgi:sphingomyelin phosphodiesterase acid-like 3
VARAAGILMALVAALLFADWMPAKSAETGVAPASARQILVLSDLHFDPMSDPKLVDRLARAEPREWPDILDSSGELGLGRYGRDTGWLLLRSTLREMRDVLPDADFLLVPGDFLAHNFRNAFDRAATEHSDAAYRSFVRKTMLFLAEELSQSFPNRPILPALGNNDDLCGDFLLQPHGPFLADTLPIVRALVGEDGEPRFSENWEGYGNYSVKVRGLRIIAANTVFFSPRYRDACGPPDGADPGRATLAWLETELAAAQQAQEPVWLLYHVPPGVDGFATLFRGSCPDDVIPMWEPAYAAPFYALLQRYAGAVAASFAGHTHMDGFRLIGDSERRYAFVLITPALSPIFGQNPAFRTVVYDAAGGIRDETTYELANLMQASAKGGVPPIWQAEYTFTRQWELPRVDAASLDRLYSLIRGQPAARQRWQTIFPVSSPVYWPRVAGGDGGEAHAVQAFSCAAGNILPADYRRCYCGDHR